MTNFLDKYTGTTLRPRKEVSLS